METLIIKGNIISAAEFGELEITESGYLIAENGKTAFPGLSVRVL